MKLDESGQFRNRRYDPQFLPAVSGKKGALERDHFPHPIPPACFGESGEKRGIGKTENPEV